MKNVEQIKHDCVGYPADCAIGLCHELIDRTIEVFGKKRMSNRKKLELLDKIQWLDIAEEIRKLTGEKF